LTEEADRTPMPLPPVVPFGEAHARISFANIVAANFSANRAPCCGEAADHRSWRASVDKPLNWP